MQQTVTQRRREDARHRRARMSFTPPMSIAARRHDTPPRLPANIISRRHVAVATRVAPSTHAVIFTTQRRPRHHAHHDTPVTPFVMIVARNQLCR